MKIIVTPEEMRSNATSLRSEKANFEQCISSMRTIVNSMSGVFEGEAAAAYVSNFESYNGQFTAFGELLESFAQKLDTAANTMEETDGGLAPIAMITILEKPRKAKGENSRVFFFSLPGQMEEQMAVCPSVWMANGILMFMIPLLIGMVN